MTATASQQLVIPPEAPTFEEMTFGQRIHYARRFRGYSGLKLAELLDVPNQTLSTWEKGAVPTRPDPFELCVRLEGVLGIPREWFAFGRPINGRYSFSLNTPRPRPRSRKVA